MKFQLVTVVLSFLFLPVAALAGPIIHAEIDYDPESQTVVKWQIGPVVSIDEETELEVQFGQDDGEWEISPELKREICTAENCSIELGIGAEVPLSEGMVEPFGKIEAEFGF